MNKNRALLLDRDGVINADTGYVGVVEQFSFLPGLFPFLRAARHLGFRLAVLTNQSGVARGFYSVDDFWRLTEHMLGELRREGIEIELVLACFEHDKGVNPAFARQSFWRKPNPGMVLEAIRRLDLDPSRSALIGNELTDIQAAQNGGICKCLLLTESNVAAPAEIDVVKNYDEALALLRAPFA
jgi:D-glycero-D-manno-heptose 1,7-bisphosphate phosphatase